MYSQPFLSRRRLSLLHLSLLFLPFSPDKPKTDNTGVDRARNELDRDSFYVIWSQCNYVNLSIVKGTGFLCLAVTDGKKKKVLTFLGPTHRSSLHRVIGLTTLIT